MSIITILSTKGGVGKSTLAVNLAVEFSRAGYKIALLDSDPQGSVANWNGVREAMIEEDSRLVSIFIASVQGESLFDLAQKKSEEGYLVLIDTVGADSRSSRSALVVADYVLTLSAPSTLDLWEVDRTLKIINSLERAQERRIPSILLFNKVSPNPGVKGIDDALDFLNRSAIFPTYVMKAVIKDRIVFQHSIREGKGVSEYIPVNTEARKEILNVFSELQSYVNVSSTEVNQHEQKTHSYQAV